MSGTIMLELNEALISDETVEEQEHVSCLEEQASDDLPPALLSYFETSKTRAAVCEKLILEELEDFAPSDCAENMTSLSKELSVDMVKLNEQVSEKTENEENITDGCPLQMPTKTQNPLTHNLAICPDNEDGARIDQYMENEKYLLLDISKYELEEDKHNSEEMHKKEERQQREMNFQEELRKIMEAEKLHQKKLELLEKRAQEKLEQELLLQQELIGNLQKRVAQERRMIEEEKRKTEEEKRKIKAMQEKSKREEDNKIQTGKEQERKIMEERKRPGEEEKKNVVKLRPEEKKQEDLWKTQEARRIIEEEKIRKKEEERKMKVIQLKEEGKRGEKQEVEEKKEMKKNRKSEDRERKEDEKNMMEVAGSMMTEDRKRQNEEISIMEGKKRNNKDEEEQPREGVVRLSTEYKVRKKQEQVEINEVQAESEEKKEKAEAKKRMVKEDMGRKDENTRRMDDKIQLKRSDEKGKEDVETMEAQDMIRKDKKAKIKAEELIKRRNEEMRQNREQEHGNTDEEIKLKSEMWGNKEHKADAKKEHERKTKDKAKRQEEVKKCQEEDGIGKKEDGMGNKEDAGHYQKGYKKNTQTEEGKVDEGGKEGVISKNELQEKKRENSSMKSQNENTGGTQRSLASQPGGNTTWTSSSPDPPHSESTASPICSKTAQQQVLDKNMSQISIYKTDNQQDPAKPDTSSCSLPESLPEHTEQKRLLWMKDCISWSKLSLQNRRKQKGSVWSRRGPRRAAEGSSLPPLCPHTLLQSTCWKSLQEVTTVTLEDLPGCSLFTLAQCTQLRSLSLRRCGIKSLEGICHLQELWYIDLQENDISFVDCENMGSLRVLRLAHNKLTSIHGLNGAENLDILDLSHNSITRIAGLESVRRLQRLSVDHNQLISTKGLRDVYTLLHLDCSHNHLASVEGLESSALLHTLDLRGNSLTEPPSLNNQVLLRELHLDDNSISSLHGLTAYWLPLMQHLSAAQNRITQLPSMSDFVSLENLDLRYNCLSELQNVCENLEGCQFLREIHLTGNPLQQESGWRSTLQKSVPGLRATDSQQTDSFFLPPAVQQVRLASGCFLTFCQVQLQQTRDLQQRHNRELSKASSPFNDMESFCRHFTMTLKLAEDQRFAHEYGDTAVSAELRAASQTAPEKTLDSVIAEKLTDYQEIESTNTITPAFLNKDNMRCSYWNFEEFPATERHDDTFGPKEGPAASFNDEKGSASSHQDLNLKNAAAVVIQQCWRKYKQKCGNIIAPPITEKGGEKGGDGRKPEPRPCCITRSAVGKDYAATVIQAFWRGYTLRRRLTSALAAVICPSAAEDDTLEEVDIDEFVFDEAALEEHCRLMLCQDSPCRYYPVSEPPSSLKSAGPCLSPSQDLLLSPKQAWAAGEHVDSPAKRFSAETSNRSTSPVSTSVLSGLSERSEKILEEWGFTDSRTALLMLRRARKMKSKRQPQKKHPSVRLALFRKCNYQLSPVEARDRTGQYNRNYVKVGGAEPGHQQAERTEQVQQDQTQQWLHSQASHGQSDSDRFLPDINSSILSGGRVQLVVNPAYADCLHHTSGLWPNSSLAARDCKVNVYTRRSSSSHIRKEVPAPTRVTSAPSKKDRISFRDNPVQLSGGWGGGKKRVRK